MRIGILGSGTASTTAPAHLVEAQSARPDVRLELLTPRLSTFASSPYERLVVDLGYVDAAQSAAARGADAVFINSFADYGLEAAQAAVAVPVVGAGEATLRAASADGTRRFGIVTVWPASMGFLYEERLRATGLATLCTGIRHVSGEDELRRLGHADGVMDRMARDEARIVDAIIAACEAALREDGAQAIALGCTCMAPVGPRVAARVAAPVHEPSRCGLEATIAAARSGPPNARGGTARDAGLVPRIVAAWQRSGGDASVGDCPVCVVGEAPDGADGSSSTGTHP
jgi:allantoin racemase